MSFSVNSNYEASVALRLLNRTSSNLSATQERINAGFKVGGAKDNASTFAIAQGMRGDVAAFRAIGEALALGEATVNVAITAATSISDKLNDLKSKITAAQALNVDRTAIQRDINAAMAQINSAARAAQFNGVNLLDSSASHPDPGLKVMSTLSRFDASSSLEAEYILVQAEQLDTVGLGLIGLNVTDRTVELSFSADAAFANNDTLVLSGGGTDYTFEFMDDVTLPSSSGANVVVDIDSAAPVGENVAKLMAKMAEHGFSASFNERGNLVVSHSSGDVVAGTTYFSTGQADATVSGSGYPAGAMVVIEDAIVATKAALSRLGAAANRLHEQQEFVKGLRDTLSAGVGTLVDADLAEESAMLQALQTKQQLGLQALSIANRQPGTVLSLFN